MGRHDGLEGFAAGLIVFTLIASIIKILARLAGWIFSAARGRR